MIKRILLALILTLVMTTDAYSDDWNSIGSVWGNEPSNWESTQNTSPSAWGSTSTATSNDNGQNAHGVTNGSAQSAWGSSDNTRDSSQTSQIDSQNDIYSQADEYSTSTNRVGLDIRLGFVMPILPYSTGYTKDSSALDQDIDINYNTMAFAGSFFIGYHINRIFLIGAEQQVGVNFYHADSKKLFSLFKNSKKDICAFDGDKDLFLASYFITQISIPATQRLSIPFTIGVGAVYSKSNDSYYIENYEQYTISHRKFTVPTPSHQAAFSAKVGISFDYTMDMGLLFSIGASYALSVIEHKEENSAIRLLHYVEPEIAIGYVF